MNIIDIVILIIALIALFKGIRDGLIKQAGGIAGLFLGIYLASKFSSLITEWLHQWINASESIVKAISFALIIIAVCFCMYLIGRLLEKVVQITTLGWVNRLLGALLSLLTITLFMGVLLSLIEYVNSNWFTLIPKEKLAEAKSVEIIRSLSDTLFPYLEKFFSK